MADKARFMPNGSVRINITRTEHEDRFISHAVVNPDEAVAIRDALLKLFPLTTGCPDGGHCHHECSIGCYRVECCGPLSGVYHNDVWPTDVVEANTPSNGHI